MKKKTFHIPYIRASSTTLFLCSSLRIRRYKTESVTNESRSLHLSLWSVLHTALQHSLLHLVFTWNYTYIYLSPPRVIVCVLSTIQLTILFTFPRAALAPEAGMKSWLVTVSCFQSQSHLRSSRIERNIIIIYICNSVNA